VDPRKAVTSRCDARLQRTAQRAVFAAEGKNSIHSIAAKLWLTKIIGLLVSLPLGGGMAFFDILKMVAG
jgi:hypothetical protein